MFVNAEVRMARSRHSIARVKATLAVALVTKLDGAWRAGLLNGRVDSEIQVQPLLRDSA